MYIVEGNLVRTVRNHPASGTYYMRKFIECNRPDLTLSEQDNLLEKLISASNGYKPNEQSGTFCVYRSKNMGINKFVKPVACYPSKESNINWKRSVNMVASAAPSTFLNIDEIKSSWDSLVTNPCFPAIGGLIGSLLSFLFGGLDFGIWLLIFSCALCFCFGKSNCVNEKKSFYLKAMKRIQFFIFPFVILSAFNLILYALVYTGTFKESHFIAVRGFVIFWIIIANCTSVLEGLEEKGYKTPKQILIMKTALEKSAKDGFKTFLTSLNKKE